jgi:hypothetical protein
MELPRALLPWAEYLDIYPPELISALGPLIRRLDAAIGSLRINTVSGNAEPDGYDGLTRRGIYDRLLLSEWLLAEEAPDEFVRRAAMGEHAFLQLARVEPAGGKFSFALFDAGPEQLGSPRIAHLAALVVLARRAAAAGVQFYWGIAQQQGTAPMMDCTASSVHHLLNARTTVEATEAHVEAWRSQFRDICGGNDLDDFWLASSGRLAKNLNRDLSLLEVSDVISPDINRLAVNIHTYGRAAKAVTLELPEGPVCARLLRDPFQTAAAVPVRSSSRHEHNSNLILTPHGSKLILRRENGGIIVYPIPNSPHTAAGPPKRYQSSWRLPIIAAGRLGKRTIIVSFIQDGRGLYVECVGGKCGNTRTGSYFLPEAFSQVDIPLQLCLPPGPFASDYDMIMLLNGRLLGLAKRDAGKHAAPLVQLEEGTVSAVSLTANGMAFVCKRASIWCLVSVGNDGQRRTLRQLKDGEKCFFGYGGILAHQHFGLLAAEEENGLWAVQFAGMAIQIAVPEESRVVGVAAWENHDTPGLIVVGPDKRTISIVRQGGIHSLPPASSEIEQITVSPAAPQIAYTTKRQEIVVWSLRHNRPVLRVEASQ